VRRTKQLLAVQRTHQCVLKRVPDRTWEAIDAAGGAGRETMVKARETRGVVADGGGDSKRQVHIGEPVSSASRERPHRSAGDDALVGSRYAS
jgi:hypothetical protein